MFPKLDELKTLHKLHSDFIKNAKERIKLLKRAKEAFHPHCLHPEDCIVPISITTRQKIASEHRAIEEISRRRAKLEKVLNKLAC